MGTKNNFQPLWDPQQFGSHMDPQTGGVVGQDQVTAPPIKPIQPKPTTPETPDDWGLTEASEPAPTGFSDAVKPNPQIEASQYQALHMNPTGHRVKGSKFTSFDQLFGTNEEAANRQAQGIDTSVTNKLNEANSAWGGVENQYSKAGQDAWSKAHTAPTDPNMSAEDKNKALQESIAGYKAPDVTQTAGYNAATGLMTGAQGVAESLKDTSGLQALTGGNAFDAQLAGVAGRQRFQDLYGQFGEGKMNQKVTGDLADATTQAKGAGAKMAAELDTLKKKGGVLHDQRVARDKAAKDAADAAEADRLKHVKPLSFDDYIKQRPEDWVRENMDPVGAIMREVGGDVNKKVTGGVEGFVNNIAGTHIDSTTRARTAFREGDRALYESLTAKELADLEQMDEKSARDEVDRIRAARMGNGGYLHATPPKSK